MTIQLTGQLTEFAPSRRPLGLVPAPKISHPRPVSVESESAAGSTGSAVEPLANVDVQISDFDAFYQQHRNEIGAALAFTLGSKSLGEEAVDEAMARAFQRWKTVSQYDSPTGWVYRVGLNWGRSWQRSVFRRKRREEKAARYEAATHEDLTGVSPELMDALVDLSVDQRAVVVLRYYCDWSVTETATALDISEGTVKSRSSRALEQLRGVLGSEMGGEST